MTDDGPGAVHSPLMRGVRHRRARASRRAQLATLLAAFAIAYGMGGIPQTAARPQDRSDPKIDQLRTKLEQAIGESNRSVPQRIQVGRSRSGLLWIQWQINRSPNGGLSRRVAEIETWWLLRALDDAGTRYRRVIVRGTYPLVTPESTGETVVLRAAYFHSTVTGFDFEGTDSVPVPEILDLADELRLAVELGGHGVPPAPTSALRAPRPS
jgi:hypothetical protein